MGGYGAYFTLSQLGPAALSQSTQFSPSQGQLASGLMLAAGIPAALMGGMWSDRQGTRKHFILGSSLGLSIILLTLPHVPSAFIIPVFVLAGVLVMIARPAYTAIPGDDTKRLRPADIATAEGLIFTLLAVGGTLFPLILSTAGRLFGNAWGWYLLGALTIICTFLGIPLKDSPAAILEGPMPDDPHVG